MPSTTGIRRRLSPALLAGAPYRVGDVMAERYRVKDAIGVGPMGYVFRASDEQQGIDVAVKMVHPRFVQTAEERQLFARTLEPARKFLQPSLARIHDIGVDQGWPYLTYSFLDGLTLRRMIDSRLAKGQTFTLEEVEPFLGQMAAALEAAHPVGPHGDLKPENVVILPDMLRITDWGVVCGLPRLPFVQAQRQKGTHRYLAPETVAGAEVDPRADLYALGVLVGEMLTGLTPEEEIPELRLTAPELPEAVEGFYRRALNEKPEARFRSVREFYDEFVSLMGAAQSPATSGPEVLAGQPAQVLPPDPGSSPEPNVDALLSEQDRPVVPEAAPISAAELPRFEGGSWAPSRPSPREVVALEPPEWSAPAGETAGQAPPAQADSGRWQALKLWDADEGSPTGAEVVERNGVGPVPAGSRAGPTGLADGDSSGSEARAAGSPGLEQGSGAVESVAAPADQPLPDGESATVDEPLLEEAVGVDLVVEGDEPSAPAAVAAGAPPARLPLPEAAPRKSEPLFPWFSRPRPTPFSREAPAPQARTDGPGPTAPPSIAPLVSVPTAPGSPAAAPIPVAARPAPVTARALPTPRPLPAPGSPPVARLPLPGGSGPGKVSPPPPPPEVLASTEEPILAVVPPDAAAAEPSAEPAHSSSTPGQARGAGTWSPAELLAQVIAEVKAEERLRGKEPGSTWEPTPLEATQPVSSEEVAARLFVEPAPIPMAGMDPTPPAFAAQALAAVAHPDDEDLPARRHEAGRAGRRLALVIAAGLVLGMLIGYYALMKLLGPRRQPQVTQVSTVRTLSGAPLG